MDFCGVLTGALVRDGAETAGIISGFTIADGFGGDAGAILAEAFFRAGGSFGAGVGVGSFIWFLGHCVSSDSHKRLEL